MKDNSQIPSILILLIKSLGPFVVFVGLHGIYKHLYIYYTDKPFIYNFLLFLKYASYIATGLFLTLNKLKTYYQYLTSNLAITLYLLCMISFGTTRIIRFGFYSNELPVILFAIISTIGGIIGSIYFKYYYKKKTTH